MRSRSIPVPFEQEREEMAAKKKNKDSQLIGIVVQNDQVATYIRKHGSVSFSKPHGVNKTILYYPNPSYEGSEAGKVEDFAGKETPAGGRPLVVQKGGRSVSTTVSRSSAGRGTAGQRADAGTDLHTEAKKASIENEGDLDKEIIEIEEDERENVEVIGATRVLKDDDETVPPPPSERVVGVDQTPVSDPPAPPHEEAEKKEQKKAEKSSSKKKK